MRNIFLIALLFSSFVHARGTLLLVGGNNHSREIFVKMVDLSQGKILIVPHASEIPAEVAASTKAKLEDAGAGHVTIYACDDSHVDEPQCLSQIREAKLVFFTGGSQNKLYAAFHGSLALKTFYERLADDLHFAGTSAGTAIMSEVMITGRPLPPYQRLEGVHRNMVETGTGFGFVKDFIVDQHFLKRLRQDRLLSAVLDHAPHVGIGIDESTAVMITPDGSMTVLGDSLVMVIDARKAETSVLANGTYVYRNISTSLLAPGTTFRLP
jgi:cyanophycinase